MDLKSVIEKDIQTELLRAKKSPQDLEAHIRAAFMNGMVLGARLQANLPEAEAAQKGWRSTPEKM